MTLARTYSIALVGAEGHLVEVEADIANGLPMTILTGLPDTALREARERIHAAILNSRQSWPETKITIELRPTNLPKRGRGFDLVIAVAILAAAGVVPLDALVNMVFFAELGLDGSLRPVPGVLPAILASVAGGIDTAVVPAANGDEAQLAPGVCVVTADSLADVIAWLQSGSPPRQGSQRPSSDPSSHLLQEQYSPDLAEVLG